MPKKLWSILAIAIVVAGIAHIAKAQRLSIVRVTLGPDQIATIRTAQGITTRVSFADPVKEIICGDLYDPNSGKGAFVVQKSENDVFLKPIATRGMTDLFVKTGEKGDRVYNFDLLIGALGDAHRVVHVSPPPGNGPRRTQRPDEQADEDSSGALKHAAEIEKDANKKAQHIITEAEEKAAELSRQASEQAAETERVATERVERIERRFVYAIMDGSRELKVNHPHVVANNVTITLDRKVVIFDGKSYLRYVIENNGSEEFSFNTISIESESDKKIEAQVIQNKPENKVPAKGTIRGVIVFAADLAKDSQHLTLYLRGQDNAPIARASIQ